MDWTLEVVVVPVNAVDRAIPFYRDRLGFTLDHDTRAGDQRFAQLTPDVDPHRTKPLGQITRIEPPTLWTMDARLAETPR
jgi:catechol 2,3-dioxygenase-like lactoylglutathione lyase family enzyme